MMRSGYRQTKLLMQCFLASEAFFFLALIIAFVYYRNFSDTWGNTTELLNARKTGLYTLLLLASSFTITWAGKGVRQNDRQKIMLGLFLTIILGIIFLAGQVMEYSHLIQSEITVSKNIFGSAFFTLTGFHGLHVLIGIIALAILLSLVFFKFVNTEAFSAFMATEWYWHFVDAVWIVVFSVVYLMPLL